MNITSIRLLLKSIFLSFSPLLHVTYHVGPEQLAAGISSLRADEGYIDSSSFPATPSASPFSPSPAQGAAGFTPDQVAEGIQRLCDEEGVTSGGSSQPPTPSTTPGWIGQGQAAVAAVGAAGALVPAAAGAAGVGQPGIVPERLAESISHLR